MKKFISIVIAVIMMAVTATGAFAVPTNTVPFTDSPVHGGNSQELCRKTCSCVTYCILDITNVNLNGQSRISFRPYYGSYKLCVYPTNVTVPDTISVYYDHNMSLISTSIKIKIKASIPSTSTSDYSEFSGTFYI